MSLRPNIESAVEYLPRPRRWVLYRPFRSGGYRRYWIPFSPAPTHYTDVTIAAVALSNQTPLLTDNRKHFSMSDLQLWPFSPRP